MLVCLFDVVAGIVRGKAVGSVAKGAGDLLVGHLAVDDADDDELKVFVGYVMGWRRHSGGGFLIAVVWSWLWWCC